MVTRRRDGRTPLRDGRSSEESTPPQPVDAGCSEGDVVVASPSLQLGGRRLVPRRWLGT